MNKIKTIILMLLLVFFALMETSQGQSQDNSISSHSPSNDAFIEPCKTIEIASAESGIIHRVYVKLGQHVSTNDLLFELDQRVLIASKKIVEARSQSTAKLRSAEILYANRKMRLSNIEHLAANSAANPEEVQRARSDTLIAQNDIDAIKEELEQFRLEVDRIAAQLESRRIRSPIHGVITHLNRKEGEHVSANDPVIATIVQLDTLRAIFYLPTKTAQSMSANQSVSLYLAETKQKVTGLIDYVSPVTRADSGRVRVDVVIDNRRGLIRSGLRCRIVPQAIAKRSLPGNRQ